MSGFESLMKTSGLMAGAINTHLLSTIEENDRRNDVYSPSLISGGCLIALILDKLRYKVALRLPSADNKRIFDNGSYTHERLQKYLQDSGLMKLSETALKHPTCGMYGTADCVLYLERDEEIVLGELKTINKDKYDKDLKGGALDNHISQITMYTGMMELRRQQLRKKYKTDEEFNTSIAERIRFYRRNYFDHIKNGKKYTRKQKLQHLISTALKLDYLLWKTEKPISRFSILYENKNNQAFKEFEYKFDQSKFDSYVKLCEDASAWLEKHDKVDAENIEYFQITQKILPKRPAHFTVGKMPCQYCSFRDLCYTHIPVEDEKREKTKKDKTKDSTKNSKNPFSRLQSKRKK